MWQSRDSAFYTNLVPDELKPQKDRRGNISFYTFQDNFPSGTIPVLFEPKGCNIVTLHGDINTVKVGIFGIVMRTHGMLQTNIMQTLIYGRM